MQPLRRYVHIFSCSEFPKENAAAMIAAGGLGLQVKGAQSPGQTHLDFESHLMKGHGTGRAD
jgi:hypothetical protein